MTKEWYHISNAADVSSPGLLIYPDRVEENLRRMIAIAGGPERLRPHVKTHKLPQIVALELAHGITRFKTATIAESEMCAAAGAPDVLMAYQPVGPNVNRIVELSRKFPSTKFSCLADNLGTVAALNAAAVSGGVKLRVFLDLNVGMNRTGIPPGPEAAAVYRAIAAAPGLEPAGLHAYDGHLRDVDPTVNAKDNQAAFGAVWALRDQLRAEKLPVPHFVAGGTPTFPLFKDHPEVELSAGTTVLWDWGQTEKTPYIDLLHAAVLITRVISHPAKNHFCLDLGHKAVASEMPHPRVHLLGLEDAKFVQQSEEHLVVESPRAAEFPVGTVFYGIPRHVCPTVALHSEVFVVRNGRVQERWPVVARARRITI
ncbi:MAG: hypothetical protein RIQ93_679 [Verrucomicrobiota bacterium]|jgi:D-serine deaminase-like pyridoxal phosphate-dependent protein